LRLYITAFGQSRICKACNLLHVSPEERSAREARRVREPTIESDRTVLVKSIHSELPGVAARPLVGKEQLDPVKRPRREFWAFRYHPLTQLPIQVSPDVFQAIWAARKPGQDTEDAILRGIFKLPEASKQLERDIDVSIGFHDPRYGVKLEPGFTIFRDYKGKRYTAKAVQGFWLSSADGQMYGTLNELNKSIGVIGAENAWKAWQYSETSGKRRPLSELRDQSTIIRRSA
jgi:hypothetical protein